MAATVRSPGARIAPIKSTLAHSHTRSLKTASKWRNTCIVPFGRVSIFSFSFGRILREAYSVFPFLSSDWIKSSLVVLGYYDVMTDDMAISLINTIDALIPGSQPLTLQNERRTTAEIQIAKELPPAR